jgi:uncharacterized protein YnzC (UPF0291/DUF896 family)
MGKNSHLHLSIETKFLNEIKEKAKEKGLTLSEYCRQRIKEDSQLDRIEGMIKKLIIIN